MNCIDIGKVSFVILSIETCTVINSDTLRACMSVLCYNMLSAISYLHAPCLFAFEHIMFESQVSQSSRVGMVASTL